MIVNKIHLIIIIICIFPTYLLSQNNRILVENLQGDTAIILKADSAYYNGQIILYNNTNKGVEINGSNKDSGGRISLYNSNGFKSFILDADNQDNNSGSIMHLRGSNGNPGVRIDGQVFNAGSRILLYNTNGKMVSELNSERSDGSSVFKLRDSNLNSTLTLYSKVNESQSAGLIMKNDDNKTTINLQAQEKLNQGCALKLYNDKGDMTIKLDAEFGDGGKGRIITQELQIKGGSDFAENFDLSSSKNVQLGMVVSIDEFNSGKLKLSSSKYDKKVVGVISGANGVDTGLIMSDEGTKADGDYPIALSGRVYVKTNEENGKIKAGNFLTTSSKKGIAMKVKKIKKAQGAIIGKAMTEADENGFVLVLVNLQ